jgi:hypothetical protein
MDGDDAPAPDGSALRLRPGRLEAGNDRIMVAAVADPRRGGRLLQQEFELARQLCLFHGPEHQPSQLTQVLCWDDTLGSPQLLLSWRGRPVTALTPLQTLHGNALRDAARDLFTGLAGLHAAGIAHGDVSVQRLWWDDPTGLQLSGLEEAILRSTPADRHEDVLAAGRVLFHLASGETLADDESRDLVLARVALQDSWLADLLQRLFGQEGRPPSAAALAGRLSGRPLRLRGRVEADRRQGLAAFDALRERQRLQPPAPKPPARRSFRLFEPADPPPQPQYQYQNQYQRRPLGTPPPEPDFPPPVQQPLERFRSWFRRLAANIR